MMSNESTDKIFVSIASYRDKDLGNTIKDAYEKAKFPKNLFFSIVSHESKEEAIDLSWLDPSQYKYVQMHHSKATGVCSGRALANSLMTEEYRFFMQTDSHTRFIGYWDYWAMKDYNTFSKYWGEDYIHSKYPLAFIFDWDNGGKKIDLQNYKHYMTIYPGWSEEENIYMMHQQPLRDTKKGERVYGFAGNFSFGSTKAMMQIPYDPDLYFLGEEISLGARAFCKGINIVSLPSNVAFTNYNRENIKNGHHWDDHDWQKLDIKSRLRLMDLFSLKDLGEYGITDAEKFEQFQKESNTQLNGRNLLKEYK